MKKIIIGVFIISLTICNGKELMICSAEGYNYSSSYGSVGCKMENGKMKNFNLFKLIRKGWSIVGIVNGKVDGGLTDKDTIYLVK